MKTFKVFDSPCSNCLFSDARIVEAERADRIIAEAVENNVHFICHKASQKGKNVCCSIFFKKFSNTVLTIKLARHLNIVEVVPRDTFEKNVK